MRLSIESPTGTPSHLLSSKRPSTKFFGFEQTFECPERLLLRTSSQRRYNPRTSRRSPSSYVSRRSLSSYLSQRRHNPRIFPPPRGRTTIVGVVSGERNSYYVVVSGRQRYCCVVSPQTNVESTRRQDEQILFFIHFGQFPKDFLYR